MTAAGSAQQLLPMGRSAVAPVEAQGAARDAARLLVARRSAGTIEHLRLRDLPEVLASGDALVVNTSAVLPAALPTSTTDGTPLRLHLSTRDPDRASLSDPEEASSSEAWLVEVRRPAGLGSSPHLDASEGQVLDLPAGGRALLRSSASRGPRGEGVRLWRAHLELPTRVLDYLAAHGSPIRYVDSVRAWPLATYQTVFAADPGSAESPSAGRGFTAELVTRLATAGIDVIPVVLHAGVSSQEAGEAPGREWHRVSAASASRIAAARRVVAVGTTSARAVETAAAGGAVRPSRGWTDLVVSPASGVGVVDGLLTGWHEPGASHLDLLETVGGRPLVRASYEAAATAGYRWHELGDFHLILP